MGVEAGSAVLLVEDDADVVRVTSRLARSYGEVATAGSVIEARRRLSQRRAWSAFVIDVGLPDGSGLDFLADSRRSFPSTPALMLTGNTEPGTINRAFDLRAEYVVKPVEASRLRRFLDKATASGTGGPQGHPSGRIAGPRPLQKRIEELRALLSRPAAPTIRHAIGTLVADLKARPGVFGSAAVAMAANAVDEDIPTLYRYACVAERWSAGELRALVGRRGRDGQPLSWSHLVKLASVQSAAARDRLIDGALSQGLSVRELEALVRREESRG